MSSRFRALLAALIFGAASCPTIALAQSPDPALGYAQRHRIARLQSNPAGQLAAAVQPAAAIDGGPAGNSQTPDQRATPTPTADLNFADGPIDDTPDAAPYAAPYGGGYARGGDPGGNYQLPRFDNGWCNPVGCQNSGCGSFGGFGPRNPIYVRAEYLAWWFKGDGLPPLVTTSPDNTAFAQAGVLGQPGTSVLFGGNGVNGSMRSGVRLAAGWWLDPTTRVEGEFFGLGTAHTNFNQSSSGIPILAQPFYNLSSGTQAAYVVAYPSTGTGITPGHAVAGSVQAAESSGFFGAGIHVLQNLMCVNCCPDRQTRWDFIYGFRYLQLTENLSINDALTSTSLNTMVTKFDGFRTVNNFYGANLGLMLENRAGRWSLNTIGRLGLGATSQHVTIAGNTVTTTNLSTAPTSTTTPGGLLALPSNIGSYSHTVFGFVPQLELKLGYNLTPNLRLTAGYDIIYWSRVARPGDQIGNPPVSTTGAGGPQFAFHDSGLWIQGVSVGGQLQF